MLVFLSVFVSCSTFDFKVGEIKDFPSQMPETGKVTQEKFPESNAAILFHGTDYQIVGIEEGKIVVKVKTRVIKKIFKAKTYSEKNRLFIDDNGKLLSVSARLVRKNGEVKHVPDKDIFKTSTIFYYQDEQKENTSVMFSDINAEDGDIVDKEYEFILKEPYSFSEKLLNIDADIPVLRREINISYKEGFFENEGKGWLLRHKYINGLAASVAERTVNGIKQISFVEKDLPERKNDIMTEYSSEGVRSFLLSVSRYNSWESVSAYYFNKSISPALATSDNGIVRNAVFKAVKTKSTKIEQIGDIVKYVRKLQYDSVKSAYIDIYSILPPSKTVELQKGNSLDKALLLKEMLGIIDVRSELIFINDRSNIRLVSDFPDIMFFKRMIVRMEDPDNKEDWLYLDPDARDNPPFFQSPRNSGVSGLIVGKDIKNALIAIPAYKSEQIPEISENISIRMVSLEKAEAQVKIIARNENYSRFKAMEEMNSLEVMKDLAEYVFFRSELVDITEYKIVPDEKNKEIVVIFKAELTPPVLKNSEKYYFTDMISEFVFFAPPFRSDKKRKAPVFLGRPRTVEWSYELILPAGYEFQDRSEKEFVTSLDGIITTTKKSGAESARYFKKSTISYLNSFVPVGKEAEYSEFLYKVNKQSDDVIFVKSEGGR